MGLSFLSRGLHRLGLLAAAAGWVLSVVLSYPLLNAFAGSFADAEAARWRQRTAQLAADLATPAFVGGRFDGLETLLTPLTDLPGIAGIEIYTVDDQRLASVRRPGARPPSASGPTTEWAADLQPVTSRGTILGFVRVEQEPDALAGRARTHLLGFWIAIHATVGALVIGGAMFASAVSHGRLTRVRERVQLLRSEPTPTSGLAPVEDMERWLPEQPKPEPAREPEYDIALEVLVDSSADLDTAARTEITALVASQARKITDIYGGKSRTLPGKGVLVRLPDGRADSRDNALYAAWVLRALITGSDRHDPHAPVALRLSAAGSVPRATAPGAIAVPTDFISGGLVADRFELAAEPSEAEGIILDVRGDVRRTLLSQFQYLDRMGSGEG